MRTKHVLQQTFPVAPVQVSIEQNNEIYENQK